MAVWFGKKKKPKGSSQPKGPWVNICKKVNGKHPPCGRPEASDKSYPKCRAAGVAGKMSDSQKRSACAQKRRAEKTHSKSGTGNAPKMVSYKPRTNESMKKRIKLTKYELTNLIQRVITEGAIEDVHTYTKTTTKSENLKKLPILLYQARNSSWEDSVWKTNYELGAAYWHRTKETLPDSVMAQLAKADVILLGAVGDPTVPSEALS